MSGAKARIAAVLAGLASLRLTLVCLGLLLVAVAYVYGRAEEAGVTVALAAPLALLAINLLAAIAANGNFRRQLALLVFHLALLAIVVLAALGRMTYLRASAEVVSGAEFAGLSRIDAGPWHWGAKEAIQFENLGFRIAYQPGLQRDRTVNRLRWRDAAGIRHETEIGDQTPLVLHGYRFYTTHNKGFAALLRWQPFGGAAELGSINFPGYPLHADNQTAHWSVGGQEIQLRLHFDELLIDPERAGEFRLPTQHELVIEAGPRQARLSPGGSLLLPAGRLVYVGLSTWMGYAVFYDWTMPWLLAACVLATASLSWHFWRKFAAKPWQAE